MLTLYADKAETNDPVWLKYGAGKRPYDVVLYNKDGDRKARIPWYYSGKPDKRYKYVMYNCFRYRLEWID